MRHKIKALGIVFSCVILACSRDDLNYIDPAFQSYVDMFFEEAQIRNVNISQDDFSFSVNFGEESNLGICFPSTNRILISRIQWGRLSELSKQYLIFHEMGHCILERLHDNEVLPNGECKSMMQGGEGNECRMNIDNFEVWRTYYLDELFNTKTHLPDWYTSEIKITPEKILFDIQDSLDERILADIGEIDPEANIKIEAYFKGWDKSNRSTLSWGNQRISCTKHSVSITDINDHLRYLKENIDFDVDTKMSFISQNGFDYYLIDDRIIHIEEKQDNSLRYIRVAIESAASSTISESLLSLTVSLLKPN